MFSSSLSRAILRLHLKLKLQANRRLFTTSVDLDLEPVTSMPICRQFRRPSWTGLLPIATIRTKATTLASFLVTSKLRKTILRECCPSLLLRSLVYLFP